MQQREKIVRFFSLLILACFLVLPFQYHINRIEILPEQDLTISVIGSSEGTAAPVTIYYEGKSDELFLQLQNAAKENDDWTYREGKSGVSWTFLSSSTLGASLTISVIPLEASYLCFESNGRNGKVLIETASGKQTIDTHTDSGSTELLRIHPFEGSKKAKVMRILVYTVLIFFAWLILVLLSHFSEKHSWIRYIVISVIAVGYLLYFSVSTSPLYPNCYGGDSAFFILVGKGMKYGYLPYRDFYDMKGPWLFVLEWLGQLVSEGRFGAFLLQCINMIGALIMFDKLTGIGREKRELFEVGLLLPLFVMAVFSIGGGNMTEELSLLPLSVVLYLGTKFLMSGEEKHKPFYAGIYGFCFGVLALIRISNAALICAVVLTIVILLIVKQEWNNLIKNAGAFIIGGALAVTPMVIFFASCGLLKEMLKQVFIYGSKYVGRVNTDSIINMFNGAYKEALYPVFVALVATVVLFRKKHWIIMILIWSTSIATLASIALSGRNLEHYYGLLIPVIALDVWFLWYAIHKGGWRRFASIILSIAFTFTFQGIYRMDKNYALANIATEKSISPDLSIEDVASHITDDGSVYCWTTQPRWYMHANKFPSFRHCGWQNDQMAIDASVGEALSEMFLNNPPDWLVLANSNSELPKFVSASRDSFFDEVYRNQYWILYQKKMNKIGE